MHRRQQGNRLLYMPSGSLFHKLTSKLARTKQFKIFLTSRNENLGKEAMKKINTNVSGNHVAYHQLDVEDATSIDNLVNYLKQNSITVDVLINNAAHGGFGESINKQLAEKTLGVNYFGLTRLTDAFLENDLIND